MSIVASTKLVEPFITLILFVNSLTTYTIFKLSFTATSKGRSQLPDSGPTFIVVNVDWADAILLQIAITENRNRNHTTQLERSIKFRRKPRTTVKNLLK